MSSRHVFLSYCRDNAAEVTRLYQDLTRAGLTVWWDRQIGPGQDWKLAIHTAMQNSSAVVLCLSAEAQQRATTGIYPEAYEAIEAYRLRRPGEVFLIPVRLNECEIPPFEIDSVRYLDRLQYVDLFPPEQRDAGVRRLIAALKGETPPALQPPAPPSADSDQNVGRYLTDLKKETAFINIRGLQVGTGRAYRFPIDQLYISLTTTGDPRRRMADDRAAAEPDGGERQPVDVYLQELLGCPRLVITGDPGTGKTTFLRRLAYALCRILLGEAAADDPFTASLGAGGFPVFVRFSDLLRCIQRTPRSPDAPGSDDSHAWLPYHLAESSRNDYFRGLSPEFFHRRLAEGGCVVMLDGLDEAPDRCTRERLSRLIVRAAEQYDGCRFVITSRPPAYTDGAVLPDFTHARIDPLSDRAVEQFLGRWSDALHSDHPAAAGRHARELLRALQLRPDIREMVRNPVMLTALAVVHWNERRLPEQRADLYASIIGWLSRSRQQRPGRPSAERTVAHLGELALHMQCHPDGRQIQVPQDWAAEAIRGRFADHPDPLAAAKSFLHDEELDSGIVVGRGADLRFWHLTFQEYLAAKVIASLRDSKREHLLLGKSPRLYQPEWLAVRIGIATPGAMFGGTMPAIPKSAGSDAPRRSGCFPPARPTGSPPATAPSATIWRATSGSGAAPSGAIPMPNPRTRRLKGVFGACCGVVRFGPIKTASVAGPATGSSRGTGASTGVFVASSNSP